MRQSVQSFTAWDNHIRVRQSKWEVVEEWDRLCKWTTKTKLDFQVRMRQAKHRKTG